MFEFRLINSFFLSIPESPVPEDITATVYNSPQKILIHKSTATSIPSSIKKQKTRQKKPHRHRKKTKNVYGFKILLRLEIHT